MKLSEKIFNYAAGRPSISEEVGFNEWANEAAKLETELEQRRTQIAHLQPVYLEVCEENEALIDALNHCGYDPDDCIDCGGSPHNEYCRFWKIRHLLSYWEQE